jgi:DNA-binding beta-propeller fold protein YncE
MRAGAASPGGMYGTIQHSCPQKGGQILVKRIVLSVAAALAAVAVPMTSAVAAASPAAAGPRVRTVMVGSNPGDIAVSGRQSRAYVLNDGSVSVLSLRTHRELAEPGTGFHDQTAIGLVRNGTRAYIGTFALNVMKVLNTNTLKVTARVRVGMGVTAIVAARTKSGQFAYVTRFTSGGSVGRVAVVRASDAKVVKTIKLPAGAGTAGTTPSSGSVWVGSVNSGKIWVISTRQQKLVRTISVTHSGPVQSIAFTPNGGQAWVAGLGGVSVVNVKSGKLLAFVPITRIFPHTANLNAGPIALNDSGTAALVVNSTFPDNPGRGAVAVLSTRTLRVRARIQVGTEPIGMAIDRIHNITYVTNFQDDTVSFFTTPK